MGKGYRQLSLEEREKIGLFKAEGRGPSEIGRLLDRDRKTIERELMRNAAPVNQGYYLAHKADARAKDRKQQAGQREWLKGCELQRHVEKTLKLGWSPELISGRIKQSGKTETACHESIYRWVYEKRPDLIGYLPRRHKQRHPKRHSRKHRKSHRRRYKANPDSKQMCCMWPRRRPPDVLEGTRPICDIENAFGICMNEDDAIDIYDMSKRTSSIFGL